MNTTRIKELMQILDNENISYGEIVEIDNAAAEAGITNVDEMMAVDILLELEAIS